MRHTDPNEPLGPDSFGGDEYTDEMSDEQIEFMWRANRKHAEEVKTASREALVAAAQQFFSEYDGEPHAVRAVRYEAALFESEDDRGVRSHINYRVRLVLVADAVVTADELGVLSDGASILDDVLLKHGWAIPVEGALVVTRDGVEVKQ